MLQVPSDQAGGVVENQLLANTRALTVIIVIIIIIAVVSPAIRCLNQTTT